MTDPSNHQEIATLAGGCFWCTEAVFQRLKGVAKVTPGYSGGNPPTGGEDPTYSEVSLDDAGHAETIQIEFDPKVISFTKLLEVFFKLHDPTILNRQGNDIGTVYRSIIFYRNEQQKSSAENTIKNLNEKVYSDKIVTEIVPFKTFYEAEEHHKEYYDKNKSASYCKVIIDPKIQKLYQEFPKEVKN